MGKRKITSFDEIENKVSKYVTYCKRKKGVIKKAMELSLLCGQEIMMAIYDKKKHKLVMYQSSKEFNPLEVNRLLSTPETKTRLYEEHTNDDFNQQTDQKLQTFNLRHDDSLSKFQVRNQKQGKFQENACFGEEEVLNLEP